MAANNWKEKAELTELVASARRKTKFSRKTPSAAAAKRAQEMILSCMSRARYLKDKIESSRIRLTR